MTLQDLFDAVSPQLSASDARNLKTSIKYLAHALGQRDTAHCEVAQYLRPLAELKAELDTFFAS